MIEKNGRSITKTGTMKVTETAAKRRSKVVSKTGKRKVSAGWFSLDSLMGKALCILLVIILTVGAFLAPKLINNLYDANSLMQITYMDMELTPYAVTYANFEDKLQAIARANTAGDHFMTLSAEERDEKISDADLIQAVNREMKAVSGGMSVLFFEGWWGELTEENLVSREKNTLYMQPQGNRADHDSYQEAPIQFWTLTFELTESNREEALGYVFADLENFSEEEIRIIEEEKKKAMKSVYATDRLMVCLDTDFYKIYAVAVEGDERKIADMYSWDPPEIFRVVSEREWANAALGRKNQLLEYSDLHMFLTDQIMESFARYWEIMPEDKSIYMDIPGELTGCVAFPGDETKTEGAEDAQKAYMLFEDESLETADADGVVVVEADASISGERSSENEIPLILLEVGCQGNFDEINAFWIQKTGCRHFFDMMQF